MKTFDGFSLHFRIFRYSLNVVIPLKIYSIEYIFDNEENNHFWKPKKVEFPIGHHYLIYVEIKMAEGKL